MTNGDAGRLEDARVVEGPTQRAFAASVRRDERGVALVMLASGECVRIHASAILVRALADAFAAPRVSWRRVGSAETVDERLRQEARQAVPDLLVLGVSQNALASVGAARRHYASIPIVVVGPQDRASELMALQAGASTFCGLPLDEELFQARVFALLRCSLASRTNLTGDVVELDVERRTLHSGGLTVKLSVSELAIVARLNQNRECWVSSVLLWQALGRSPAGYDSSLVRTHVLNVRRKLGPQRWILQTERGKGTMLTTVSTYKALTRESS